MNAKIHHDLIKLSEEFFTGSAEQQVECEIIVPDYCPDVLQILRVDAAVHVHSAVPQKDSVQVAGSVEFAIMYRPESSRAVRCLRQMADFNQSFDAKGVDENSAVMTTGTVRNLGCRLHSSRKMTARATGITHLRAERTHELSLLRPFEDDSDGLQSQVGRRSVCGRCMCGNKSFKLEEELEIGAGKPQIAALVRSDVVAVPLDVKVITNKVVVKGVARVYSLYISDMESGSLESMEHEIPFNQILEMEGVDENSVCTVSFDTEGQDFSVIENADGENRILGADVSVKATATAYSNMEMQFVEDAYSTDYEYAVERVPVSSQRVMETAQLQCSVKEDIESETELASVVSLSGTPVVTSVTTQDNRLVIAGALEASLLAVSVEGDFVNIDKSLPFSCTTDLREPADAVRAMVTPTADNFSFSMSAADNVAVRAQVTLDVLLRCQETFPAVKAMSIDASKPRESGANALILYYPDRSESLWEIAKRYNTTVQGIRELNRCEEEAPACSMLMIPRRKAAKR